jgi:hypothetical protein
LAVLQISGPVQAIRADVVILRDARDLHFTALAYAFAAVPGSEFD